MMNRQMLLVHTKRRQRSAIDPIIATLLLILIAVAAGVVVYAYVLGFIGNTTTNPGGTTSIIEVSSFCMSASTNCNGGSMYVTIINVGSTSIILSTSSAVQLYFTDMTKGTTTSIACPATSPTTINVNGQTGSLTIIPTTSYTCSIAQSGYFNGAPVLNSAVGDTILIKVVNPDSGTATQTTKVIS